VQCNVREVDLLQQRAAAGVTTVAEYFGIYRTVNCVCSLLCIHSYLLHLLCSCPTGRAINLQAACPDEQASKYAAYLQSKAGKQQLESALGLSLPTGTSLMGLPQYGRQLYTRPSYLQLRDILAQLFQDAGLYGDKTVLVSGTPGIGKSFCALYLATHFIAQGTRVVYEFHPVSAAGPTIWYHFPPNSSQGFLSYRWEEVKLDTNDADTIYLVDGGLPLIPSPVCWCYAFLSPQRQVYRWATKSPSAHLLFLPLWTLDELQACRSFVTAFEEGLSSQSVTEAYEIAGGIPRTVLRLAAHQSRSGIAVKDLVLDTLKIAVGRLSSQASLLAAEFPWLTIVHVDHCSLCTVYLNDKHIAVSFYGSDTSVCNELSLTVHT